MSLFPVVLVLGNTRVHIGIPYSGNVMTYVKASVNKAFGLGAVLEIPYTDLYNSYI